MNINDLNNYTQQTYGFKVFDWDNHPNEYFISQVDCKAKGISLADKSIPQVAKILNDLYQANKFVEIKGKHFEARNLNFNLESDNRVPNAPIIFITGDIMSKPAKTPPSVPPAPHAEPHPFDPRK